MKKQLTVWRRAWKIVLVTLLASCGSADEAKESVGTSVSALAAPGLTPVPCIRCEGSPLSQGCAGVADGKTHLLWDGNRVQLMVADAYAQCSGGLGSPAIDRRSSLLFPDDYLLFIQQKMISTLDRAVLPGTSVFHTDVPRLWREQVRAEVRNCNLAGDSEPITYPLETSFILEDMPPMGTAQDNYADFDLKTASVNLCIAESLRQQAPGASAGAAVLLPAEEQLELINTIRERAQIATVQYALLAAMNNDVEVPSQGSFVGVARAQAIRAFFADPSFARTQRLREMGADFATAIQLTIATTEELAELFARSRSARMPYKGGVGNSANGIPLPDPATEADRTWGPASWQQRLAALLYGGDAFNAERGGETGAFLPQRFFPYATVPGAAPEVQELLKLARYHGTVNLGISANFSGCDSFQSFDLIYPNTQRALQRQACVRALGNCATCVQAPRDCSVEFRNQCVAQYGPTPYYEEQTGWCAGVPAADILAEHGIKPEHGEQLTKHLQSLLSPMDFFASDDFDSCVEQHPRFAPQDFRGQIKIGLPSGNIGITLSRDFGFEPRKLENIAGIFGFGSPVLADRWEPHVGMEGHGFSGEIQLTGLFIFAQGYGDTLKRMMGSVNALTYARRIIERIQTAPSNEYARIRDTFLETAGPERLVSLISAAIGDDGVSIRRLNAPCDCAASSPTDFTCFPRQDCHAGEPARDWNVHVRANEQDPILRSPDWGGSPFVIMLRGGWVESLLAAPDRVTIAGQTALDVLRTAVENGDFTRLDIAENGKSWVGQFNQDAVSTTPTGIQYTVAVYRGDDPVGELEDMDLETLATRVRLLTTGIPFDKAFFEGTNFLADATYTATGGSLGQFAKHQLSPSKEDVTRPGFDGFDLPEGWVPPFSAELYGREPGTTTVSHFIDSALEVSKDAAEAVDTAMTGLLDQQIDISQDRITEEQKEAALLNAAERAQAGLREEQAKLCGIENQDCEVGLQQSTLQPIWYPSLGGTIPTQGCTDLIRLAEVVLTAIPNDPFLIGSLNPLDKVQMDLARAALAEFGLDLGRVDPVINDAIDWAFEAVGFDFGRSDFSSEQAALDAAKRDSEFAIADMRCFNDLLIQDFMKMQPSIAAPVFPTLTSATAPTFNEFGGGELQSAFIEQWRAIKEPNERFDVLQKTVAAMAARVDASNTQVATAGSRVRRECSHATFQRAFNAGWSGGFLSLTWSPGPLNEQQHRCDDATEALGPVVKEATAENKGALMAVSTAAQGLTDAQAAIAQSGASIERLTTQAQLATERVELEKRLETRSAEADLQTVLKTSFGLYRRYRDADLWRAKALLELSRRHALIARRAVEAHFVVDLSQIAQDEAFVVAPRSWADEIYEYDLSLPAAVGLVAAPEASDAIAANKVEDYVRNLQAFVNGYAVTRPSAIARNEIEVLTLPGVAPGSSVAFDSSSLPQSQESQDRCRESVGSDGEPICELLSEAPTDPPELQDACRAVFDFAGEVSCVQAMTFPEQGAWQVHCANSDRWVPIERGAANLTGLCERGGVQTPDPADRIRLPFDLDPWGQVNGDRLRQTFTRRYNGRWTKLAVNLVGTGVLDCTFAVDPLECYSRGHVRYDLRHTGKPWITDFFGEWHRFMVPTGVVEGGKAVALERWLEPLVDGWETSYIGAVARTEFEFRPLGGQYLLEIALRPEIRPDRIERVQILAGSEYWVAQEP